MRKFSTIVLGSYFILVVVFAFVLLYFVLRNVRDYFTDFQIKNLQDISKIIERNIIQNKLFNESSNKERTEKYIFELDTLLNIRITLIDYYGNVIFDTHSQKNMLDNHFDRPEIQEAMQNGMGSSIRFSKTIKKEQIYCARLINIDDSTKIFVRVSINRDYFASFFSKIQENIVEIFIALVSLMLILSVLFSRRISNPIEKIIEAWKKIVTGDFNVKIHYKDSTEIGELIENFNLMINQIHSLISEISFQKDFMRNLINSLEQGIAIYDQGLKIIFCNNAYQSIFSLNELCNLNLYTFQNEILINQFQTALNEHIETSKEINIKDKFYYSSIKLLPANQYLHFLYDISPLKQIDSIKRDLVANVSHELRTPLTAIKGYIENLEEIAFDEQRKYIEIVKRNTDRIILIVNDLLQLMSLEDSSARLEISNVNLGEICELVISNLKGKISEKELNVILDVEKNLPLVRADAFRIEQVFINLLDNAIKYSEKGTIKISIERFDDEQVKILISDEGIGIPNEHLSRIFERFYTVDKSRSRKTGGTGLGLSIVKHIILMHDGNIQVKSQLGKGTTFTIYLPIN